jgi:hypothetical protein
VTDTLIENEFDRDAGIGTGQHRREWFLLSHGLLFQNSQILIEGSKATAYEAGIAVGWLGR